MGDIAYQNKDITAKAMADTLKGRSLAAFGLPHLKVVDILPTNLPAVESNELRLDNLFVLDDGSVAIIDYESDYKKENFIKYVNYIARVMKRYAGKKQLDLLVRIKMIVIYTADVDKAETVYDLEGIRLLIEPAFLVKFDTHAIFKRLDDKIYRKEMLSEEEVMELMILPLTVKGHMEKNTIITAAVKLAKQLEPPKQALQALAGILTFSDKIIDKTYKKRIMEEMRMTQIAQMFMEEGEKNAEEKIVRTMLSKNKSAEEIHRDTDLPMEFIKDVINSSHRIIYSA